MEKDELKFEKPVFGRGKDFIALVDEETKKGRIHWKMDVSHDEADKRTFIAYWRERKINLKLQEERNYLSLSVFFSNGEMETFSAMTDPSLNGLFARVEYIHFRKMKRPARRARIGSRSMISGC